MDTSPPKLFLFLFVLLEFDGLFAQIHSGLKLRQIVESARTVRIDLVETFVAELIYIRVVFSGLLQIEEKEKEESGIET